ncbi:SUMF1/EgtB/PvdO family nonheme iron enzyme [Thiorhodovibrio frisius]|uniref:Sulfatase-modifying factor enzyme-like domain-containing protein n=1 Tax=Thiorhodovibrio frisius TaxID=631362 RepID=H8Z232_9GAMM|nr:SUMF1/EgtB/PvdO family nonheme iron enzyme [Thiorhodovibrio frisius]EIC21557.1 hypothetical protein Thi970DRAFT_01770 [Thiorhodovibrio frisius]WPL24141.1 Serine/threonine-protein kinase pkn1 [Thiorhodovibrio frisius]
MPDQPSQSKPPATSPSTGNGQPAQRNISAVAADLAIQQENEGLRLALREQERIVEELTNECRRLEDRLEDRYQDIDALRRELDRGERALKQAEERPSQLVGDTATPAAGAPEAQAAADAEDSKKSTAKSAGAKGSPLSFAAGLLSGVVLAAGTVTALWFAGLMTLTGQKAISPQIAEPAPPSRPPATPTAQTQTTDDAPSNTATPIAKPNPAGNATAGRPDPGTDVSQGTTGIVSENQTPADADRASGPASSEPLSGDLRVPAEPVAGTHTDVFLVGDTTAPEMVALKPSEFMMGNPVGMADSDARPVHRVSLDGFMIGAREVTFSDYDRYVRETGARRPQDYGWGRGSRPVIDVSWDDAMAYAKWLGKKTGQPYRLPTEAEWEYAARGGSTSSFWWGIGSPASRALCVNCGTRWDQISTAPVGSFPPNPFGLYDTAGNVYEWTTDCYHHSYQGAPSDGSARSDPGCASRAVRGGSFKSPAGAMRSHARNRFSADARADMLGFRVARDLTPPAQAPDQAPDND